MSARIFSSLYLRLKGVDQSIYAVKMMVLNWELNCDVFALPDIELNNAANN